MEEQNDIFSFITSKKEDVPDEIYFTALAEKIIQEQKSTSKVIQLYKKPFFRWAVAASIILPLAIYFISQGTSEASSNQSVLLGLNDIPQEDIHTYIMENMEEFNLSEVSEMVTESTLESFEVKTVTLETNTTSDFFESLSTDEIESYFDSQDIDIEDLEQDELFI